MKITIIIPAYNEAEGVQQTADALLPVVAAMRTENEIELIFVNDGSKDDTLALLQRQFGSEPGTKVLNHEANRGLGAALRTGFESATGEIVITTDFDGTYSFESLPLILAQLLTDKVDMVTASPYHPKGKVEGVPPFRLIFSFGASFLYRLLVNWHIYCWTALFRAYKRHVIKTVPFESNDFLAGTEIIVGAIQAGYTVTEFPATLRVRTYGQSSMKVAKVTKAHLKFQWRILRSRLLRKPLTTASPIENKH